MNISDSGVLTEVSEKDIGPDGTFVFPAGVTTIVDNAFHNCLGLTTLTIRDGVTTIEWGAFASSGLTSLTIPDSVTTIANEAFEGCDALEHIYVRQRKEGGLERVRDLLPTHLHEKLVAVAVSGRLTKRAAASSTTLFTEPKPDLSLDTLFGETEKQISSPGQVQLLFKTLTEAQAMQNSLEHAGMYAGASAAQYAIEDMSKADESKAAASAAGVVATHSASGYAIEISKSEYNQLMDDESAYDRLSQRANDLQP